VSITAKNLSHKVLVIIPARLASTRLQEKLLLPINGKALILSTLQQAKSARNVSRVIVATDAEKIFRVVEESGAEALMTSPTHQSGTDRISEVAEKFPEYDVVVNVQGDEPMIATSTIEKTIDAILKDDTVDIATASEPFASPDDILSADVVKVVTDDRGNALYFSRAPIPFPRDAAKLHGSLAEALNADRSLLKNFRKHTGIYVFRREFLLRYTKLAQTHLEKSEMLEQLRALENGAKIRVVEVDELSVAVDTKADFERVRAILEK